MFGEHLEHIYKDLSYKVLTETRTGNPKHLGSNFQPLIYTLIYSFKI